MKVSCFMDKIIVKNLYLLILANQLLAFDMLLCQQPNFFGSRHSHKHVVYSCKINKWNLPDLTAVIMQWR